MDAPEDVTPAVWSTLRSSNLLSEASDASIEWLAKVAAVREFAKGEQIFVAGTPAREIGIVMQGHTRAVHFGADGRAVTVLISWPGDPIALLAGLAGNSYQTVFEAAENGTTIAMIPADAFSRLMRDEPDVMVSVIGVMSNQMLEMVTMLKALSADVPSRVAIFIGMLLDEQSSTGPGPCVVDLGMPRVEVAARLGTVPETLSRAFHALQDEGLIEGHGQLVTVLDRDALIARTNGVL